MKRFNGYKIQGVTMLEMMLVIAIAAALMLMGINMYRSYQEDKDYILLRMDVELLFQAMQSYYQHECDLYFSSNGLISHKGALTFNPQDIPSRPDFAVVPFNVTFTSDYLGNPWPRKLSIIFSPYPEYAYFAQFSPSTGTKKQTYVCSSYTTGKADCTSPPMEIPESNIVLWQSQIVVKMKDPTKTTLYVAKAGADCAVATFTPGDVVDCSAGVPLGSPADYMVWQRTPSFSAEVSSSHWISNPVVKEFKLMYTHDPMYELYNSSPDPNDPYTDVYKHYYCGG